MENRFISPKLSYVTCLVSGGMCQVSHVTCDMSQVYILIYFYKAVKLVCGGSRINRATPSCFDKFCICHSNEYTRAMKPRFCNNQSCHLRSEFEHKLNAFFLILYIQTCCSKYSIQFNPYQNMYHI